MNYIYIYREREKQREIYLRKAWRKNTATVFPRGSNKRKFNNDDKHNHGQEKSKSTI